MLCRTCKTKMKDIPSSFDTFNFLQAQPQYCENKECEEWGYITMVGYPEKDKPKEPEEPPHV